MTESDSYARRSVLKVTGAAAATAFVAGCGGPGDEGEELPAEEETGNGQDVEDDENGEDAPEGTEDENEDEQEELRVRAAVGGSETA